MDLQLILVEMNVNERALNMPDYSMEVLASAIIHLENTENAPIPNVPVERVAVGGMLFIIRLSPHLLQHQPIMDI